MTNALPYSTVGGYVTRGEAFAQLLDYLRLATDCCQRMSCNDYRAEDYAQFQHNLTMAEEAANVIGHLFNTEDDEKSKLLAHGWYGVAEMFHNNRETFRRLATMPHINRWRDVKKLLEKVTWNVQKMYESKLQ